MLFPGQHKFRTAVAPIMRHPETVTKCQLAKFSTWRQHACPRNLLPLLRFAQDLAWVRPQWPTPAQAVAIIGTAHSQYIVRHARYVSRFVDHSQFVARSVIRAIHAAAPASWASAFLASFNCCVMGCCYFHAELTPAQTEQIDIADVAVSRRSIFAEQPRRFFIFCPPVRKSLSITCPRAV